MKLFIFSALVCCALASFDFRSYSNITVIGTVICGEKRIPGVLVELREAGVFVDETLNTTRTDLQGNFKIFGEKWEIGSIEPYLRISHACRRNKPNCELRSPYPIPDDKINGVYNMTFVNLDVAQRKEEDVNCK
ncbi:unnamed protein product, partial [Mesorhabditis spiculigera]